LPQPSGGGIRVGSEARRGQLSPWPAIPVAGGLTGGSVDAALTGINGKAAKKAFAGEQN
jgi:hypothetical protein